MAAQLVIEQTLDMAFFAASAVGLVSFLNLFLTFS
jgi:hypothetical protein